MSVQVHSRQLDRWPLPLPVEATRPFPPTFPTMTPEQIAQANADLREQSPLGRSEDREDSTHHDVETEAGRIFTRHGLADQLVEAVR